MKLPQSFTTVTTFSKILAMVMFVALPFGGYYFGNKYISNKYPVQSNEINKSIPTIDISNGINSQSWIKPISTDKAIPIVKKDNILYWYSLTKKQLNPTKYKVVQGSGSYGQGEDSPLPSPDGKFIAFINYEDRHLYILPSGSNEAIKITDYQVNFLNSWSSDGSKILYYSHLNNLDTSKESDGMGNNFIPWETSVSFSKGAAPGFHYFDIENGQDTFLYPLSAADKFIDDNRILVEMNQNENNNKRFVLFNVDTFTADFSTINYPIKSVSTQKSFSADGALWARTIDDGYMGDEVKIVFSKFPNDVGDIVDTAPWSFIQRPLLNSNGKYLAYTKKGDQIEQGQFTGQYPEKTVIWDTTSKKIIKELKGFPKYWANEDTLLIGQAEYGQSFTSYDLYNVSTQTTDVIPLE